MIQVIRHGVFETNSSSSHSFSLVDIKKSLFLPDNYTVKELVNEFKRRIDYWEGILLENMDKLDYCEGLIAYLEKVIPNFKYDKYLKRIKELLFDEEGLESYNFSCDRNSNRKERYPPEYQNMDHESLLMCVENLFGDINDVEAVCNKVKKITLDSNYVIAFNYR